VAVGEIDVAKLMVPFADVGQRVLGDGAGVDGGGDGGASLLPGLYGDGLIGRCRRVRIDGTV